MGQLNLLVLDQLNLTVGVEPISSKLGSPQQGDQHSQPD
jgi:hypothetical protein